LSPAPMKPAPKVMNAVQAQYPTARTNARMRRGRYAKVA
jgi:hypothetical protein